MHPTPTTPAEQPVQAHGSGVSRRRLIRAGASAVPVLAALKANTVLATGTGHYCIKPSTFASLNAAHWMLSQGREPNSSYTCHSHGYWNNGHRSWPVERSQLFLSSGFTANPSGIYTGKTLEQVLKMSGSDEKNLPPGAHKSTEFARNIVGLYLDAKSANDVNVTLTAAQCVSIWNSLWVGGSHTGTWEMAPGVMWSFDTTNSYILILVGAAQHP